MHTIFAIMLAAASLALAQPAGPGGQMKAPAVLYALPLGAVKPAGWIRDWSVAASRGITGHLDERSPTFGQSWSGVPFEARGAKPDGTGWPLEQGAYWLDGAIRLAYILDDRALIAKVRKRLDVIVDGVLAGGETFIFWRPRSSIEDNFNDWAHSHVARALVAYYSASQDPRVLQALLKVYKHYRPAPLPGHFEKVGGAVNVDPMLETYLATGDADILAALREYAASPGYRDTAAAWNSGTIPPGHNVIFYEHIRVPATLYPVTGDLQDLSATLAAVRWHDARHLLPIGLSSGEEWHAGIGSTRNVETCNIPAATWTFLNLLKTTGNGEWSDRIERIFFNAGPAPVARDFQTLSYYQSANRFSASLPLERPSAPGGPQSSYLFTDLGHPVLCCAGNLNRVIPNYVMHLWMATRDHGLAAALYGPSEVRALAGANVPVQIKSDTAYPFDDKIRLTVHAAEAVRFPLYLRIPAWTVKPEVKVNGKPVSISAGPDRFLKIDRTWKTDDTVEFILPMRPQVEVGRETPYPDVPYFAKSRRSIAHEKNVSNPYAYVNYGPLLFALPIPDKDPNQETGGTPIAFVLDVDRAKQRDAIRVVRKPMPETWTWSLASPLRLTVPAREINWTPTDASPMPATPVKGRRRAAIELVPYGLTKFRISMFPIQIAPPSDKSLP